jgi:microcystin-dependent protein
MSTPFLGEIKIVAFNFPPKGWALCNGQLMAISQSTALFALLGTTYGGDGVQNFALPNLQSRAPISFGQGPGLSSYVQGQLGGEISHTLVTAEIPAHSHALPVLDGAGSATSGAGDVLAQSPIGLGNVYSTAAPDTTLGTPLGSVGGQPHENRPPYLALNFVIALQGIFPSQN